MNRLGDICTKINQGVPAKSAKCQDNVPVEMKTQTSSGEWFEKWFSQKVGMCELSDGSTKCVTLGPGENKIYVFSYTENLCSDPQPEDFNFSVLTPAASFGDGRLLRSDTRSTDKPPKKGGLVNAIMNLFRCCFGG